MPGATHNIAGRTQASARLARSQYMLARTEGIAHVGSWEWDVATDTVTWSDELFRIFQKNPADGPPSFAQHSELYSPQDMQRLSAAVASAVSHGMPYELELRAIRTDGETRVCLARGHAELGPDGIATILFGSLQDITERKQVEEALKESEAFARTVLDSVSDQVAVIDQDGVITAVNAVWRRFALKNMPTPGNPVPDTDIGLNYLKICQPGTRSAADNSEAAREGIQAVLDGRLSTFSLEYACHSSGQPRWFRMRVTPLGLDGRGAVIAHTDITAKIEADLARVDFQRLVQEKEERLALAVLHNGIGIWDWNLQTLDMVWDDSMFALYRLRREDFSGAVDAWEKSLHPDDRARAESEVQEALQGVKPFDTEFRVCWSNGEIHHIKAVAKVFLDEAGKPVRMLGTNIDITQRKRNEAELDQHRHHLEALVQQRTSALSIAKEAAEAANRAKAIFLATMSHELRTPMNGIMGMTELSLGCATGPKQVGYLNTVSQCSKRLLALINDILEFTRAESETLTLDTTSFILADVLEVVSNHEGQKASGKGIEFLVEVDPGLARQPMIGDRQRLEHILLALTDNAIKFTSQGSVTVRVKADEDKLNSLLLRFEVWDTGIGIAAKDQRRLFTAFEQMDGSMTRKYGGSGLGLALSQSLVRAMDGDMGVDSEVGRGSLFWFSIPAGRLAADAQSLPAPLSAATAVAAPATERPPDTARVAALVAELLPLLGANKFDALGRFKALQEAVAGSALAAEIDAAGRLLQGMDFAATLERLRRLATTQGWDKSA